MRPAYNPRNAAFVVGSILISWSGFALAHGIGGSNAHFVQAIQGPAVLPFMYLGAKHMVTGFDHLLYLAGVLFFLYRPKDVVVAVSLFTLGHSITLLAGVLGGIKANAHLIYAVIGISVVYKAFENLGGFEAFFGARPNMNTAVFVFGLCHGFGLATKLQEFQLAADGLVANIVSFNVGVEVGQLIALSLVLALFAWWRRHRHLQAQVWFANVLLMLGGFLLTGRHIANYLTTTV